MLPIYRQQPERAAETLAAATKVLPGESTLASVEAVLWATRGEKRKAEQAIQRALRGEKPLLHTHHMWHWAAAAYALIGKAAPAIRLLRKASEAGLPTYPGFRDDRLLSPLHGNPQFLRLMADLKREWSSYKREFGHSLPSVAR